MTQVGDETPAPAALKWSELVAIFLVGAFGGTSPFLLRLALDLINTKSRIEYVTPSVLIGVTLLALLGGGMAMVWKESDLKKAFYLGLGLPSLLTVATSNAPQSSTAQSVLHEPATLLLTVHAAEEGVGPAAGRTLRVFVPSQAGSDLSLTFRLAADQTTLVRASNGGVVRVPDQAVAVTVSTSQGESAAAGLPARPSAEITLKFRTESDPWYGFWYAVGKRVKPLRLVPEEKSLPAGEVQRIRKQATTPRP